MKQVVMTKSEVFRDYNRQIAIEYKKQVEAEVSAVRSILSIGKLLDEARQYRDSLSKIEGKRLWSTFEKKLGFSPANISKYIRIYNHPLLRLKKYERCLPASIFSLYELAKIPEKNLQHLIANKSLSPQLGRSQVVQLLNMKNKRKDAKQVELFRICVPAGDLIDAYDEKYSKIAEILESYGIEFQDAPQVSKLKKAQNTYAAKLNAFTLKSAKVYLHSCFKQYVEAKGINENKWNSKSRLSFVAKLKRIGFNPDEISTETCSEIDEVKRLYVAGPFDGESEWNKKLAEWYSNALENVPVPKILKTHIPKPNPNESSTVVEFNAKRKTLDFTGVKV